MPLNHAGGQGALAYFPADFAENGPMEMDQPRQAISSVTVTVTNEDLGPIGISFGDIHPSALARGFRHQGHRLGLRRAVAGSGVGAAIVMGNTKNGAGISIAYDDDQAAEPVVAIFGQDSEEVARMGTRNGVGHVKVTDPRRRRENVLQPR